MKLIKLNYEDPDLFNPKLSSKPFELVDSHLEAFMQMYRTQGSTFWLRFLVTYKCNVEKSIYTSEKWLSPLTDHSQGIKVLNFVYISLHKKFIEGSNTAVKKLISNLVTLALYRREQGLVHTKSFKQIRNVFKNLYGIRKPSDKKGMAFIFNNLYLDFFAVLCTVFEFWFEADDLSEEGVKNLDSTINYWSPTFLTNKHFKPHCFEKYLSNYWKGNLQKMLLTDDVHNLFSSHISTGCCEKFDKERDFLFTVFTLEHAKQLLKMLDDSKEENVKTYSQLNSIFLLKPQAATCKSHKKCFVKICHASNCPEPFICEGHETCKVTCETNLKNDEKENNCEKFWKIISIDVFSVSGKNRDVSTFAESNDRQIQTYLHARENLKVDKILSVLNSEYSHHQYFSEKFDLELDPRKTECVSRLRKKLNQKQDYDCFDPPSLRFPEYRENLLKNAQSKMTSLEMNYCSSTGHHSANCSGKCYNKTLTTVSVSTANAFGRVMLLSKYTVTVRKSKKNHKTCRDPNTIDKSCKETAKKVPAGGSVDLKKIKNKVAIENFTKSEDLSQKVKKKGTNQNIVSSNIPAASGKTDESTDLNQKESGARKVVENKQENPENINAIDISAVGSNDSNGFNSSSSIEEKKNSYMHTEDDDDDDIDEILKLIGIGEVDEVCESEEQKGDDNTASQQQKDDNNSSITHQEVEESVAVEHFFKLIKPNGVPESTDDTPCLSQAVESNRTNLKVCAFCKKVETQRKMFKKCSRCKEENFPVQHYYCSRECLLKDWVESHEAEHSRYNKQL